MIKNIVGLLIGVALSQSVMAGNPDRVGQSGAQQLLVNPWARSSGWGGVNVAGINGVECMQFNIAGLADIHQTEFLASRVSWLGNSAVGININAFGFAQTLGADDAIGLSVTSWDFGDIPVTTVNSPEPIQGSYRISMVNIGVGYAHKFSNAIRAGILMRGLSEGVTSVSASGIAIDAGIQYFAGEFGGHKDRIKIGVSLRNVGPTMSFSGGGLSTRALIDGSSYSMTIENRANEFELPSMLNIGASYDLYFDSLSDNKLTIAASFMSNAFEKDQEIVGLQYSYRSFLMLRRGFNYEADIFSSEIRTKALVGPSAGVTVDLPFGDKSKGKRFGVDYSYRSSIFTGTHTFGLKLTL